MATNGIVLALLVIAAAITYTTFPRLAVASAVLAAAHIIRIVIRRRRA